ncbi:MAG: hypothetical protein KF746_21265 [Chitinophagaceae bacterium]|nr:hypothetical protein [Chitinophagaceae bacterium]
MLEQITWKDFAVFAIGGSAAYYGILILTGKLKLGKKIMSQPGLAMREQTADNIEDSNSDMTEEERASEKEFESLELLADELQVIITQSASENVDKEQLLQSLRREISRYKAIDKPAFRGAITNLIIKTAQQELGLEVSKQEAMELWSMG